MLCSLFYFKEVYLMNNNENINVDELLKLLNISNDGSFIVKNIEIIDDTKFIHIEKKLEPTYCPRCYSKMHSKGFYTRKVNHPVFQDTMKCYLIVRQRKWHCPSCDMYLNDSFPFLDRYSHSTSITPYLVLNEFKNLNESAADIAKRFNISDSLAHMIFERYVDLPRLTLPEYISIDEVHLNISDTKKYAFVIMDFTNGQIVDIVHNRWLNTLEDYFYKIPREERLKVKCVICDAYQNYLTMPEKFFPNACSVLDSFHAVKVLNSSLNMYINGVAKKYKKRDEKARKQKNHDTNRDNKSIKKSREVILLQSYKWVLLKNQDHIRYSFERHYHKLLHMEVDTYQIEKMFLSLDENFTLYRDLKEEYIEFNHRNYDNKEDILNDLNKLIDKYKNSGHKIFEDYSVFLENHKDPIVNSFTRLKVYRKSAKEEKEYYARLSNGPMESFNRKPKDLKRNSRGLSDFNYTRNRILWSTRSNPSIKGVPKSFDQIKSKKGKKRGPYSKKNNK